MHILEMKTHTNFLSGSKNVHTKLLQNNELQLVSKPLTIEKNSAKKKEEKTTKDRASLCTAVRQMLIDQVLPNSKENPPTCLHMF